MARPDDRLDALINKLSVFDDCWAKTFPQTPEGYAKLQKLIRDYGYGAVRSSLEYAWEHRIKPLGPSAMPVMTSLCKKKVLS